MNKIEKLYQKNESNLITKNKLFKDFFRDIDMEFSNGELENLDIKFEKIEKSDYDNYIFSIFNLINSDKKLFIRITVCADSKYGFIINCSQNSIFKKDHIEKVKNVLNQLKDFVHILDSLDLLIKNNQIYNFNNFDEKDFDKLSASAMRKFVSKHIVEDPIPSKIKIVYDGKKQTLKFYDNFNPKVIVSFEDFFIDDSLLLEYPLFPNKNNFHLYKEDLSKKLKILKNV